MRCWNRPDGGDLVQTSSRARGRRTNNKEEGESDSPEDRIQQGASDGGERPHITWMPDAS